MSVHPSVCPLLRTLLFSGIKIIATGFSCPSSLLCLHVANALLVVVVAAATVAAVGWLPLDFPFLIKLTLSTCLAIIQQLSKCFSAHLGLL